MRPFRRNYNFRVYRLPKKIFRRIIIFSFLLLLTFFGMLFKILPDQGLVTLASIKNVGVVNVANNDLEEVLDSSIPMLAVSQDGVKPGLGEKLFSNAFYYLVGIQLGQPSTFLQAEIPYLRNVSYEIATADDIITEQIPEEEDQLKEPQKDDPETVQEDAYKEEQTEDQTAVDGQLKGPLVAIYNTHTGEAYSLTEGTVRKKGERGGVYLVAEEIKQVLEQEHGIGVVHSDIIHDYDYREVYPYGASEKTAREILKENKEIKIMIDVHRDAISGMKRSQMVTEIDGEKYAKIFFVVGSNKRQNHPEWEKNYEFAKKVSNKINEMYPGLVRKAPQVQDGRYNQHLHPNALLVEFGEADTNYTEEAVRSAKLFANVLAEVLKDMK